MECKQNCDPDAKKEMGRALGNPQIFDIEAFEKHQIWPFWPGCNEIEMSKMKKVAKIEIVLHDPYSNALCTLT